MANPEHVEIVKQGINSINKWKALRAVESLDLREAHLRYADLSGANLERANLEGASLERANLAGANLERAYLTGANLTGTNLAGAHLVGANLADAHLREASLERANLAGANLAGASLVGADLADAHLAGADLADADLAGAHLTGADLAEAHLVRASLVRASLARAHLVRASLARARLRGASLERADLAEANLERADLEEAYLIAANLAGAHLAGAHLRSANLSEANLERANLEGADLSRNKLEALTFLDVNLTRTILRKADLTLSRFIRCKLDDAVIDDAIVTGIDVQDLRGLPKPPETLRLNVNGEEIVLTGSEAKEFFHLPAIVEVYVTTALTQQELGCYHFHLGEVHHAGIATGVYLVGHRYESDGSVLRFQAKSYEEIYQVLPDMLAPFRMSQAIDWKQTLQAIPLEERGEAITVLATVKPKPLVVEWRFAERMAQIFKGYQNARVIQLSEWGRSQRIRIEIVENPDEVQRFSQMSLPEPWDEHKRIHIETGGGSATIQLTEEDYGVSSSHQHFYGGHFQGRSFGDHNSLTNYFGVVDKLDTVEEDIKQKLKEAREVIERADISDDDKRDAVDDLNKLTDELGKPEKDNRRVQRYWNRIKEVAPTVASILASAASLAKLLGGG